MKSIDFFNKYIKDKEFTLKKQSKTVQQKYPKTCCIFEWKNEKEYVRFRILYNGVIEAGAFLSFEKVSTRKFNLDCKTPYKKFFKTYAYPYLGL
jgi:hypothetical protein